MIKLCGTLLCKPLKIIFKLCITKSEFPSECKKATLIPVHKTSEKRHTSLKNYTPNSLLPVVGKMFERIIYNNMFEYFTSSNLVWPNQSGFKPDDSCINQLLSITNEIYHSLDNCFEIRGAFLDISKTFYKLWHDGLILEFWTFIIMEYLEISYSLSKVFLKIVNKELSWMVKLHLGLMYKLVLLKAILGPIFFLIYINDLLDNLSSNPKLFEHDKPLFSVVLDENLTAKDIMTTYKKYVSGFINGNWASTLIFKSKHKS